MKLRGLLGMGWVLSWVASCLQMGHPSRKKCLCWKEHWHHLIQEGAQHHLLEEIHNMYRRWGWGVGEVRQT